MCKLTYLLEDDSSKRYKKENIENTKLKTEKYIFGCEFEFYLSNNDKFHSIVKELYDISKVDLLVNELGIPSVKDASECMHLKPDETLDDSGWEISIPKCSYDDLKEYIVSIHNLISKYGYTNDDTGLHIHISTYDNNGINLDFYKFALLSNEEKLLDSWSRRNQHCYNVMDIVNYCNKKDSNDIKTKKGRIWNLEKVSNHRIEIRTMGGKNYHKSNDKIFEEIKKYYKIFIETLKQNSDEYINLRSIHLEKVKDSQKDIQIQFSKLFID